MYLSRLLPGHVPILGFVLQPSDLSDPKRRTKMRSGSCDARGRTDVLVQARS